MVTVVKECKTHGMTNHSEIFRKGVFERHRCAKCLVDAVTRRRRKMKLLAIEYKGGCCERCGYSKSIRALEFHHMDPSQKDFAIGHRGLTRSWERTKAELEKCILVCANCHREIHDELLLQEE